MVRKKVFAGVAAAVALLTTVVSPALAGGTGGPSPEFLQRMPRISKEADLKQISEKLERDRQYIRQRESGQVGTNANDGPSPPASHSIPTSTIPQSPVADDNRVCVHCGPTSTLIALRYLASAGRLSINDLTAFSNSQAIKKLGDGYLQGANSGYAILVQNGDGSWGGDQWRMQSNLNARLKANDVRYNISNSNSYSGAAALSTALKTPVWANKPVILLVNTKGFKYYEGRALGHYVALDGYALSGASHRINDPNNCAWTPSGKNPFGQHWVPEKETWEAVTLIGGQSNLLW